MLMAVNTEGLLELLDQHNQRHQEAHIRLRGDFRDFAERVDEGHKIFLEQVKSLNKRLDEVAVVANTPVDVTKLVATPRIVFAIVTTVVLIFSTIWASTSGLRSDVRDILTRMTTEERVSVANAKVQELNNQLIKDSLGAVTKRQDLLTLQYNQLNEQMIRLTNQKGQ